MFRRLRNFNVYDLAYGLAVGISAPVWWLQTRSRQKVTKAFAQRMGYVEPRTSQGPAIMIHAVSLGEINAVRGLVSGLQQLRPDLHIIISTTTETGTQRAHELYEKAAAAGQVTLVGYPLDFTPANARVLDRLRPNVVVLMELEVWPNFLLQCAKRNIPVALVNGRMTEPSFHRYRLVRPIMRRCMERLSLTCVQDQVNAERFLALGAIPQRLFITGTMKFDTATVSDRIDGDAAMAEQLGLQPPWQGPGRQQRIWVCGSTGPGEEKLILQQYQSLRQRHPNLRLVLVPRKPERFDEVAQLIASAGLPLVRRSAPPITLNGDAVILGDTMGELRKFYSLADIIFVGRTLLDLGPKQHGSDMIEPAALAKPVIVGQFTGNFADAMAHFQRANSIAVVTTADELGLQVQQFLADPQLATAFGARAQEVVRQGKGATQRHLEAITGLLQPAPTK